ncbi:MAG: hypothetical protein R2817_12150 [Flavobacteriales bacterium]
MNHKTIVPMAMAVVLLSGCWKDGEVPPSTGSSVALRVRFELHCDGLPYHPDSVYRDGFGTRVRIAQFRTGLIGATVLDDEGMHLGQWPEAVFPLDAQQPEVGVVLTGPTAGEAHYLDARLLMSGDQPPGLFDSLWVNTDAGGFLAVLDLRGIVDSNSNGLIDPDDAPFRIAVPAPPEEERMLIHAHATIPADGSGELLVPVNLRALLHDIDLPDQPITIGSGPYATQAMNNLRTRVWGEDNKPR